MIPVHDPLTRDFISQVMNGIRVDTSTLAAATYLLTGNNQTEIFNVYGRIKVHNLFGEVITALSNNATTLYYNFTSSSPSIAVQPLSAACASLAQLAQGERIWWVGGAVATAVVLTATPGISDINTTPQVVGTIGGTATIGILTAAASMTSGAVKFSVLYTPMSDGAYVTAVL